jgi:hypothetical protein
LTFNFSFDGGAVTGEVDGLTANGSGEQATHVFIDTYPSSVGLNETAPFEVTGPTLNGFNSFDVNGAGQITAVVFDACNNRCAGPAPFFPPDYIFCMSTPGPLECGPPLAFLEGTVFAFGLAAGNDLTFTPVTTPLPATLPLFATGLGGLGLLGWRKKRKAQAVA